MHDGRSDLGASALAGSNEIYDNGVKSGTESSADKGYSSAILATAVVRLQKINQRSDPLRALCDTGSQGNMISMAAAQKLGWPKQQCNVRFNGINGFKGEHHKHKLTCELISRFNHNTLTSIELVIVPEVIGTWLPATSFPADIIPKRIQRELADPEAHKAAPIDILLGAGVWATIIMNGAFTNNIGIAFHPSHLGWLIFGGNSRSYNELTIGASITNESDGHLDSLLRRFWEIEEISPGRIRTTEQERCEELFMQTHRRLESGRYEVSIPLRGEVNNLGSSRAIALHRFHQLERRLIRDPELQTKYCKAMADLQEANQMRLVDRPPTGQCFHIPHHPVLKKFRIVFDASCRTDRGVSLNEMQLVGERLQDDLADLIMRFRCHPVAVTADIKKMYLQVGISADQWDLQRIFWRPDKQSEIQEYWLTVVTFGMASAPHCAVRAMIQGARELRAQFPMGAAAIERDFYIDDGLTGAEDVEQARRLCHEMDATLRSCGFTLDKWRSNRLNVVPYATDQEQIDDALELSEFTDTTVLGLRWLPKTDELLFKFQPPPMLDAKHATKRKLLSHIAQIFDPNGYIGPVITVAKIIMQKLWCTGLDWDSLVPDAIYREWQQFQSQLSLITQIRIPRWLGINNLRNVSIHGFADASEAAYGAVLYVRVESTSHIECILIAAKSKVAPIKTVTIPRLELCAAQMLSELVQSFKRSTGKEHLKTTLWSDSTIVLSWLLKDAATLKTFVNNRVQKIQRLTTGSTWRHVPTADNPADLISRGMSPAELQHSQLWWNGPSWLVRSGEHWPNILSKPSIQAEEQVAAESKTRGDEGQEHWKLRPKRKDMVSAASTHSLDGDLLSRSSDAHKLFRSTAWVYRFISNCRIRGEKLRCKSPLTNQEVDDAVKFWLRREQSIYYQKEIKTILENNEKPIANRKPIDPTSAIIKFNPMMVGEEKILRLGGRLEKSLLPFEQKHPVLLPDVSPLAKLLVRQAHVRTLHGGQRQMAALLRQKFWITNLRRLIHTNNSRCIPCLRQRKECAQQMMADLPADRSLPCRPFRHSGVDYAGPFQVKARGGRSNVFEKKYVAVFICMVTKAVHLELAEDLTTAEFIQAFLRFTSIRGSCTRLWSDNGKNFVGAETELARMLKSWNNFDMAKRLQKEGTEWRFITPSAPHQGGLWEAAVKSMKYHLRRVIGAEILTSGAFRTTLAQVSAVLNSRPIAALTDDPESLDFLTPAHFLIGESIVQPFGAYVQDVPDNRLTHAAKAQKRSQLIWKAWNQNYLHELQQRTKWKTPKRNLKVGDLVLIREEDCPPTLWKTGRITNVFPGADGLVRNVRLKTAYSKNELDRPVQKLCLLLPEDIEAEPSRAQCVKAGTNGTTDANTESDTNGTNE